MRLGDRVDSASRPGWRDDLTVVYARTDQTLVMRAADGSGGPTEIGSGMQPFAGAGRLVFMRLAAGSGGDLYHLLLPPGDAPPGAAVVLQQLPEHEWEPALSSDGTLLAYNSGDRGQSEVILRTYPNQTGRWQVSSAGGSSAVWSPRGDALYYRDIAAHVMRVEVRKTPALTLGAPQHVAVVEPRRAGVRRVPDGTRLRGAGTEDRRHARRAVVRRFAPFSK